MSNVLTMNPTQGDLLKWEDNPNFSREVAPIVGGAFLLGTVLTKSPDGTMTIWAPGKSVDGVLINDTDASEGPTEAVIVQREVIVSRAALVFAAAVTAAQKEEAYAGLVKLTIIPRETA
jgi:hypothetical protein